MDCNDVNRAGIITGARHHRSKDPDPVLKYRRWAVDAEPGLTQDRHRVAWKRFIKPDCTPQVRLSTPPRLQGEHHTRLLPGSHALGGFDTGGFQYFGLPEALQSRTRLTGLRVPLMHACLWSTMGATVLRSKICIPIG